MIIISICETQQDILPKGITVDMRVIKDALYHQLKWLCLVPFFILTTRDLYLINLTLHIEFIMTQTTYPYERK